MALYEEVICQISSNNILDNGRVSLLHVQYSPYYFLVPLFVRCQKEMLWHRIIFNVKTYVNGRKSFVTF